MTVPKKLTAQLRRARTTLSTWNGRGIGWLYCRGYHWVSTRLSSSIALLESNVRSKADRTSLSDAYYLLGDIHDFNDSPLAAIEAYKRSIAFDPVHAESWRELACRCAEVGENQLAREAIAESLRLDNSDQCALSDWEDIQELSSGPAEPQEFLLFRVGDVLWDCRELLSNGHVYLALERLHKRRSISARLLRLRALGMLSDTKKIIEEWEEIARSNGRLRITMADWYYMPEEIYDSAVVWETLKKLGTQWIETIEEHKSLQRIIIPRWDGTAESERRIRKQQIRCKDLKVELHLARTSGDLQTISELCSRYPKWTEARRVKKSLGKKV